MDDCQANNQPSAIIFKNPMSIFLDFLSKFQIQKWRQILLLFLLAALSIFGWLRLAETIKVYTYLNQLGLNPHPLYFIISGALIGILFLIAWITRLTKSSCSTKFIHLSIIILGIQFFAENMVLSINKSSIFSLVIEFMVIIIIYLLPEKPSERLKTK